MKKALVPGTFDPVTAGHLDVIERAAAIFDEVVVGVAMSRNKGNHGPLFSIDERVELVSQATASIENVSVQPFDTLLVDFARSLGAGAIVKGLRAVTDFEHEFQQAALNYHLSPDMETLFIMSSPEHMYLSSSVVKEIAALGGNTSGLVPVQVEAALKRRFSEPQ